MTQNLSGVFKLDLTLNDIIFEAYDTLQVATDGEDTTGGLFNRARRSVQMLMKLWESQGIHLWTFEEGSLFMQVGLAKYDFRLEGRLTSDIHLANTFEQRALSVAAIVGADAVTLDDVDDLTVGDQIGILNDENDLEWFLVMKITAFIVQLNGVLAVASADSSIVYTYDYLNSTTLTTANAGTDTLIVADTTILNEGNTILVLLDDDTTVSRIISTIDQGTNTVVVTVALPSAAAIGNAVLNDTTRRNQFKPVKRVSRDAVRRRESTDYEIPIVFQSRKDYFDLPNKNQVGTVIQTYFDRQQQQGIMFTWLTPSSAQSIVNFTYERELQVPINATDTFDLPEDWYLALVYGLAELLIPKVGCSAARQAVIKAGATSYLDSALGFDQAVYGIRLKPMQYG